MIYVYKDTLSLTIHEISFLNYGNLKVNLNDPVARVLIPPKQKFTNHSMNYIGFRLFLPDISHKWLRLNDEWMYCKSSDQLKHEHYFLSSQMEIRTFPRLNRESRSTKLKTYLINKTFSVKNHRSALNHRS